MNRKDRIVLCIAAAFFFAFTATTTTFGAIFLDLPPSERLRVDANILTFELLALAFATTAAFFALSPKKKSGDPQ